MERVVGSTEVNDVAGGFIVRMGAVAAQRTPKQLKDLMYLCANALNCVAVEDEDMKKLVITIEESLSLGNSGKYSVPFKRITNNNKNTGNTVGTDDLMKLNKELKENS